MANNLFNRLNYAQQNTGPNGCRLCNHVFNSTDALLRHIESHMAQEEATIRRLYSSPSHDIISQMQLGSNQFQSPPPTMGHAMFFQAQQQPMVMPQPTTRNPLFNAQYGSSSQPIRQMHTPPQQPFSHPGNFNGDGSRAYIMKLEKPIKKIDFIDLVNVDDDSEMKPLDLELKL